MPWCSYQSMWAFCSLFHINRRSILEGEHRCSIPLDIHPLYERDPHFFGKLRDRCSDLVQFLQEDSNSTPLILARRTFVLHSAKFQGYQTMTAGGSDVPLLSYYRNFRMREKRGSVCLALPVCF